MMRIPKHILARGRDVDMPVGEIFLNLQEEPAGYLGVIYQVDEEDWDVHEEYEEYITDACVKALRRVFKAVYPRADIDVDIRPSEREECYVIAPDGEEYWDKEDEEYLVWDIVEFVMSEGYGMDYEDWVKRRRR